MKHNIKQVGIYLTWWKYAWYLSVSGFLLASKDEPIINLRQNLLIHPRSRHGSWMLSWWSLARPVLESKALIRCDVSAWRPLESWTGKQSRWQSVSNAPKPEENLAAETSPFMLVHCLHNTSSFLMCASFTVILFCSLHRDENTGPDLHYLAGFFLSDIYNCLLESNSVHWVNWF